MKRVSMLFLLIGILMCGATGCGASKAPVQTPKPEQVEESADSEPEEVQAAQEKDPLAISMEELRAANEYKALLKNHGSIAYSTSVYADQDVDNGYLGFDNTLLEKSGDGFSLKNMHAMQSEPETTVYAQVDGVWNRQTQWPGEPLDVEEYESEEETWAAAKVYLNLFSSRIESEQIKDASWQDDAIVLTVETKYEGIDEPFDVYYWVEPTSGELLAINQDIPSGGVYGTVSYITTILYDAAPDWTIEIDYDMAIEAELQAEEMGEDAQ